MTTPFPHHIRSLDDALYFLWSWAFSLGGSPIGIPSVVPGSYGALLIEGIRVVFAPFRTELRARLALNLACEATSYRFDYRRDDALLWRADCHPGHEAEFGGPYHLHIGPSEHVRVASPPYSLHDIAELVARTNRGLLP